MPSKSKKQAKLMAAVAHNPKFAKKVGIPQSVGREFNEADQKLRKYAEGGKVRTLKKMIEWAKQDNASAYPTLYGENSPYYHKLLEKHSWDPDLSEEEFNLLARYGEGDLWHWAPGAKNIDRMDELIKKYGIRAMMPQFRGLQLPEKYAGDLRRGDTLTNFRPSSTSTSKRIAEDFLDSLQGDDMVPTMVRIAPNKRLSLPLPITGQSELVMPAADAGKLRISGLDYKDGQFVIDAEAEPHPGFADGGQVLPSSQDEEESWSDTYLKRPLSGLASMWGGTDPETGEFVSPAWHNLKRAWNLDERRRQGLSPQERATLGIVDETISLPALGGIVGLPVPEFAEEAEGRAGDTREAARESLGLDAPHGFKENLAESAGVMAGQLPVPASVANKLKILKESGKLGKVGKILGPATEWFSPTVVPKAKNYLKGTLFGGLLGGGLDYLEDKDAEERNKQFISEAIAEVLEEERVKAGQESGDDASDDEALAELGYAEGGKVKAARKAIGSLRESLENVDEDKAVRQAKLDAAMRAITKPGNVELPKTIRAGLNEQRETAGLQQLLDRALPLLQPARQVENFDPKSIVSNLPPPLKPVPASSMEGHGNLTDEQYNRLFLRKFYHDRGANPGLSREMQNLDQEDLDWEKMFGRYATGGEVGVDKRNHMIPAPQAQKGEMITDSRGAPLSQAWFENYGSGPERLFLGDRTLDLGDWSPTRSGAPKPPPSKGGGSSTLNNIVGLGTLGLMGWDVYKDIMGDPDQASSISDFGSGDIDVSGTQNWINKDLSEMEMPTAEIDPSAWDRTKQGAGGALDLYIGSQQGGAEGVGNMLSGSGDLYQAFGGKNQFSDIAGPVGGILKGVADGTVTGYLQAGGDAVKLAQAMGYSGPVLDSAGNLLPVVGQLFSAYEGIQRGDPVGYAQAAGSLYGAASSAGLASSSGALAASGLSTAAPLAALGFAIADTANTALGHNDRRNDLYASRMHFTPIATPQVGKIPGVMLYQMSNGKIISRKDMEWLSRLSKSTGKGDAEADARHAEAVQALMADSFHSNDFSKYTKKWLDENGYQY